jgi:L-amino acid N-acyltransferase YncA
MTTNINIREASENDFDEIWPTFKEIVIASETYAFDRQITKEAAFEQWIVYPRMTFVVESDGKILGTYFIKTNQAGPGSHVCNCGYMVSRHARGKGLATAMCEHSQNIAKELGYKAMQFNLVIETNEDAVRLWHSLGFEIVGTIPKAFEHPKLGFVGAHVMYKWLE